MWITSRLCAEIAKRQQKPDSLRARLLRRGATRWIDLGSTRFDEGFFCIGLAPRETVPEERRHRYTRVDILDEANWPELEWGSWDLVRMQHVFEHFSFEAAQTVLRLCGKLLKPGGHLLVTVPDLRLFALSYLTGFVLAPRYRRFAQSCRVPEGAPGSAVFSVFAHQTGYREGANPGDAHRWCYDYKGLAWQVRRSGLFEDIRRLSLLNPLAEVPFTHNRPDEDACLLAVRAQDGLAAAPSAP